MRLQNLAVIFIIIILPISMVLTSYIQSRVETLNLQISYDQKLYDSTYDAVIAFQKNTVNSSTSDLTTSKLRDIEASINSFFISAGENFGMSGYGKQDLEGFVPAIVYTLYDGYYIYSPYTNTLDQQAKDDIKSATGDENSGTYKDGEILTGLKPYIYYSCRYKNPYCDVVINYALDSYVTITGMVDNQVVNLSGYLLSSATNGGRSYRGVTINEEQLIQEKVLVLDSNDAIVGGTNNIFETKKINGVKYYRYNNQVFTNLNSIMTEQPGKDIGSTNDNAIQYYKQAEELKNEINNTSLKSLKINDAIGEDGEKLSESADEDIKAMFSRDEYLFEELNNALNTTQIEDDDSVFNEQRINVIKYSVERNLSIAISNYNNVSGVTSTEFQLPKLKDYEWERIANNISVISFLQGMSIGGKIYNGYVIVNNNKNEEFVSKDSIYILTSDNEYHNVRDSDLTGEKLNDAKGYLNVDFEIKSGQAGYYCPRDGATGCYSSIITSSDINIDKSIEEILKDNTTLASIYYTALGRERYSMYRIANK